MKNVDVLKCKYWWCSS